MVSPTTARPFHVLTLYRLNNMDALYNDPNAVLLVHPHDDVGKLPQRYRAFIADSYGRDAERAWTTLQRLVAAKLAVSPDADRLLDMAWLLGLRDQGGQRVTELRTWQRSLSKRPAW